MKAEVRKGKGEDRRARESENKTRGKTTPESDNLPARNTDTGREAARTNTYLEKDFWIPEVRG